MTEPKLISPMLDNFAMGGAISDHDGVRCYPAMENDTNDRYIVKIISIPASQTQLDALLLSGAYPSKDAALVYFKELSEGIIQEAEILNKLSQVEGFLPYKSFQCVPMEEQSGFDVYLLGSYKRTLTKQFIRHPLTHLDAVNLGLDLCAALSVCRRAGFLYVALKPNNVFVTNDKGFRIGDLGFVRLDSLKYASLPDKYRSEYTAPEISDAFSSLNTTIDVYALGLILYQAYNNGTLPLNDEITSADPLPPPAYADYEMAEIILKACAPNPEDRWQDPMEMGQAIVTYMQRNGANDTPIVPPISPICEVSEESDSEEDAAQESESAEGNIPPTEDLPKDMESPGEESDSEETPLSEESGQDAPDTDTAASLNEETDELPPNDADAAPPGEETEVSETIIYREDELGNLSFLTDDPLPSDEDGLDIEYEEVTDEVNQMLSQADELANHPVPDPVIPPEPIDVPVPAPIVLAEDNPDSSEAAAEETHTESDPEAAEDSTPDAIDPSEEATDTILDESPQDAPSKKSSKRWLRNTLILLAVAVLLSAGVYYYLNFYLLPVNAIVLEGSKDSLTVQLDTDIDESLLTVVCSDTYGTALKAPVVDGKATFTGLVPNTGYKINVTVDGFHRLTGNVSSIYSTPVQTNVVQYNAVTGSEDGSVILSFTVEGPDSTQWRVTYAAEGEEEKTIVFPSHTTTIEGLTIGKEYTFQLKPEDDLYITGDSEVKHTASTLVYATDLQIISCENNTLTATWSAPEDAAVDSWIVRCYNDDAYNETVITSETTAVFENLDHTSGFTVEVTASGMSVSERAYVEKNSITVSNFSVDDSDPNQLVLTWDTNHEIPADGWILSYTIDGSAELDTIVCEENRAVVNTVVPGASYGFALTDTSNSMILGVPASIKTKDASAFTCNYENYTVTADNMTFRMCKTPDTQNWTRYHLSDSDYTNTFSVGQNASFLVQLDKSYGTSGDNIVTLFVIRDENGTVVSADTHSQTWSDMWYRNYCELDIPNMPKSAGNYTISVYFNGSLAAAQDFVISG